MSDFDFSKLIFDIPDYPKPGVVFKDITPLFDNAEGFKAAVDAIADHYRDSHITKVVGAEARGFIIGAPVAVALGAGFVPARKAGKLPRETVSQSYELEYSTDTLEIHRDAFAPGDRVLILDDLIATGGTIHAVKQMVDELGAEFAGYACVLELAFLNPRKKLDKDGGEELFSLIKVE